MAGFHHRKEDVPPTPPTKAYIPQCEGEEVADCFDVMDINNTVLVLINIGGFKI